ncbi:MAG: M23 family metallopeptidase [Peptococcaceae bacterium]|nr:M23 family metallopeptidase [Peptococcaceae bacterium]
MRLVGCFTSQRRSDDFCEIYMKRTTCAQLDQIKAQYESQQIGLNAKTKFSITAYRDPSIYYYVYFPGYGYDYFHVNSQSLDLFVATQQSAQCKNMYNRLYNKTNEAFICKNLYGTYSTSQGGAHEGIDFSPAGYPSIYAMLGGTVITPDSGHSTHQLCVQTSSNSSYSYLHMSYKAVSPGSPVSATQYVGTQGALGNADGPHVHFEVAPGNNSLQYEGDNILASLYPYLNL